MTTAILPETSSIATFGGTKRDIQPAAVPDAEIAASEYNSLSASVAAASHTAARCWARVTVSGGVATLASHDAVWGNTVGVAPTVVRASAGRFTVTWASAYDDLRETPDSHATNIRTASATAYKSSASVITGAAATATNVITVRTDDAAGSASDPDEFTAWGY